jgi:hypothetical protein
MAPVTQLSKAGIRLLLQQLLANNPDVAYWDLLMRMSLVRGGLIDLTIYGHRVASAPRFAFMAVSGNVLAFLAKHPRAPAINFTFDVPVTRMQAEKGQAKLTLGCMKMSDAQVKIHEAAIVFIAQWLTALCTPTPIPLAGASLPIETGIRFICANTLGMPQYVQHLTDKFITQAGKLALSSHQVADLVNSCRGEDDALLIGLAGKLVEKKLNEQIGAKQLDIFLCSTGNRLLKERVEKLEKDMGFKTDEKGSEMCKPWAGI